MAAGHQLTFPPEVQALREPVLSAMRRAVALGTLPAVQEAQRLVAAWLSEHPEDYAIWDAGEPLAMLEDALLRTQTPRPLTEAV